MAESVLCENVMNLLSQSSDELMAAYGGIIFGSSTYSQDVVLNVDQFI